MDIVSKKLAEVLELDDMEEEVNLENKNPLTNQTLYSSSLISTDDIESFNMINDGMGLEAYSKIILMKASQKAMTDHDELIAIMAKVDDSKAARMAEVAQAALSNASDAAKALMNFSMAKEKLEIEKTKLEIKSVTINNVGIQGEDIPKIGGTQHEVLEQIKNMMDDSNATDDPPPLIDI